MKKRLAAILTLLAVGVCAGDDTPSWRSNPARTGGTSELIPPKASPDSVATLRWSTAVSMREQLGSPAIGGGRVYVGSEDGTLYCLHPDDGSVLWSFSTLASIVSTPAYFEGRVFVASRDGYLYALHGFTGDLLYAPIFHGTAVYSSPLVVPDVSIAGTPTDVLYVALGDPAYELRAYDAKTGAWLWTGGAGFNQISWSSPVYHAEFNRVVVGDNSGYWYAYDASTGAWLWTYRAGTDGYFATAACWTDYVAIPGGGGSDRNVHILKQLAGPPYYSVHKVVLAIPPASTGEGLVSKVGGDADGQPLVTNPQTKVTSEDLMRLMQLPKADRDAELDALAAENGISYNDLKEWLDIRTGDTDPQQNKPETDPVSYVNLSRAIVSSSPAFVSGRIIISHREMSGVSSDSYFTVAIDVTADPANTKVVWGTQCRPYTLSDLSVVASPAVSGASYVWNARGQLLEGRAFSDGNKVGVSVDVGAQILGGPTIANGRVFLSTERGEILCYDTGNNPPIGPNTFQPTGGTNITTTNTPTLSWFGHIDAETAGGALLSELQVGIGYANKDLELSVDPTIQLVGGSSYPVGPIANNTHVYWRVRIRDANGAWSPWSDIQDFWVNKDAAPPAPPQSLDATPLANSVQLDWTASPSPDILKYHVYYKKSVDPWSSAQVKETTGLTYTVTGLDNGVSYDFMVTAVDQGENESAGLIDSATPNATITIGGISYPNIQAAIDAASPGDTVVVGVGTFVGALVLKPGVSLRGYSAKHTRIVGTGLGPVVDVQGAYLTDPQSEISHLAITNGQIGIRAGTSDLSIHHVAIYSINGHAITSDVGGKLQVLNTTLMSNVGRAIDSATSPVLATFRNNLAGKNGGGLFAEPGSSISYNASFQNSPESDYGPGLAGAGNTNLAATFTDEAGGDFTEAAGSSSVDASDPADPFSNEPSPNGGRRNQGAFGDTEWARTSPAPAGGGSSDGGGGGGGGGGCGMVGLEALLFLALARRLRRR